MQEHSTCIELSMRRFLLSDNSTDIQALLFTDFTLNKPIIDNEHESKTYDSLVQFRPETPS